MDSAQLFALPAARRKNPSDGGKEASGGKGASSGKGVKLSDAPIKEVFPPPFSALSRVRVTLKWGAGPGPRENPPPMPSQTKGVRSAPVATFWMAPPVGYSAPPGSELNMVSLGLNMVAEGIWVLALV